MTCTFVTESQNFYMHEKDLRTNLRTFFSFFFTTSKSRDSTGVWSPREKQVLSEPARNINNVNNVNNIEKG